jgi:hypothetical protein
MGYGIPSEDFLALCVLFAKGNMSITIDDLIRRVAEYQRERNSFYGVCENDFQEAIIEMISLQGGALGSIRWNDYTALSKIRVKDLIEPMLQYYDVWFNDSDVYWSTNRQMNRKMPTIQNVRMRQFFQMPIPLDSESILRFLEKFGWNAMILDQHLYSGMWRKKTEL